MLILFPCIGKFNYHKLQVMEAENRNNKGNKMQTIKNILTMPLNWITILFVTCQLINLLTK